MIIPCFRCKKKLDKPDASNAEYIIAEDMKITELQAGLPVEVQKTGIICPDCYKPTDFVVWGVHKKVE